MKHTESEKQIIREARSNRPACIQCHKLMEPSYEKSYDEIEVPPHGYMTKSRIVGVTGYGYDNIFCTLKCGYAFGRKKAKQQMFLQGRAST